MPQMDLGVRIGMVLLVVLLMAAVVLYHVWLDRLYQRGVRRDQAEKIARGEAEKLPEVKTR